MQSDDECWWLHYTKLIMFEIVEIWLYIAWMKLWFNYYYAIWLVFSIAISISEFKIFIGKNHGSAAPTKTYQ